MGCKDAVLLEPILKKRKVICLSLGENTRQPYDENLCLSRAILLHLHGNHSLGKKLK